MKPKKKHKKKKTVNQKLSEMAEELNIKGWDKTN